MEFIINNKQSEQEEIEWQNWYEGDEYSISCTRISFNEERKVFYLINENDNVGTSVYATNPENSKYPKAIPHGVRLVNALCRLFKKDDGKINATSVLEAVDAHLEANDAITISVSKTKKGVLWQAN